MVRRDPSEGVLSRALIGDRVGEDDEDEDELVESVSPRFRPCRRRLLCREPRRSDGGDDWQCVPETVMWRGSVRVLVDGVAGVYSTRRSSGCTGGGTCAESCDDVGWRLLAVGFEAV